MLGAARGLSWGWGAPLCAPHPKRAPCSGGQGLCSAWLQTVPSIFRFLERRNAPKLFNHEQEELTPPRSLPAPPRSGEGFPARLRVLRAVTPRPTSPRNPTRPLGVAGSGVAVGAPRPWVAEGSPGLSGGSWVVLEASQHLQALGAPQACSERLTGMEGLLGRRCGASGAGKHPQQRGRASPYPPLPPGMQAPSHPHRRWVLPWEQGDPRGPLRSLGPFPAGEELAGAGEVVQALQVEA